MITLTIDGTSENDLARIQPGDVITHIDTRPLPRPAMVDGEYANGRIPLINDRAGSAVVDYLYPDTQVGSTITVMRRQVKRTKGPHRHSFRAGARVQWRTPLRQTRGPIGTVVEYAKKTDLRTLVDFGHGPMWEYTARLHPVDEVTEPEDLTAPDAPPWMLGSAP